MARHDGRADDALRKVEIVPGYLSHPDGSVLIRMGETQVLCAATIEDSVPVFLRESGLGWITGEYAMLPAATSTRMPREINRGRPSGRTMEIQRLVGRALRSVVDRKALGARTVWVDCDVLQADGGTRTAGITGGFLAMCIALDGLRKKELVRKPLLSGLVAAISVGMLEGRAVLDLDYVEDSGAQVDLNVVRTDDGRYVEIQGTAETSPFSREHLDAMLELADRGIDALHDRQREILGDGVGRLLIPR